MTAVVAVGIRRLGYTDEGLKISGTYGAPAPCAAPP